MRCVLLLLLCALGCGAPMGPSSGAEPVVSYALQQRQWQARPLLVFGPSADDPRLRRQLASLDASAAGLAERDMDDVRIAGEQGQANGAAMRPPDVAALRARFEVPAEGFTVILIGKDGSEKLRTTAPVEMETIFETIDAMPIRRQEMQPG